MKNETSKAKNKCHLIHIIDLEKERERRTMVQLKEAAFYAAGLQE